jgi:fumarylpyruvate hydrolase
MTSSLHHEGELVVALGKGGLRIQEKDALEHVLGYAVGCDLTRRDLQTEAKKLNRPWSVAKGFDYSAPCGPILPKELVQFPSKATVLSLQVNGQVRQASLIENMIWKVPEIISHLSKYFRLKHGDLIFSGTPSGVASLNEGDNVRILCGELVPCEFSIGPPE